MPRRPRQLETASPPPCSDCALVQGCAAIAFSLDNFRAREVADFATSAQMAVHIIKAALGLVPGCACTPGELRGNVVNVNVPFVPASATPRGFYLAHMSSACVSATFSACEQAERAANLAREGVQEGPGVHVLRNVGARFTKCVPAPRRAATPPCLLVGALPDRHPLGGPPISECCRSEAGRAAAACVMLVRDLPSKGLFALRVAQTQRAVPCWLLDILCGTSACTLFSFQLSLPSMIHSVDRMPDWEGGGMVASGHPVKG